MWARESKHREGLLVELNIGLFSSFFFFCVECGLKKRLDRQQKKKADKHFAIVTRSDKNVIVRDQMWARNFPWQGETKFLMDIEKFSVRA